MENNQGHEEEKGKGVAKFKPGSGKMIVKSSMFKTAGAELEATLDQRVWHTVNETYANETFGIHESISHNPVAVDEWAEHIHRMGNLTLAKKLASALAPTQKSAAYGLRPYARAQFGVPKAYLTLANQYGFVSNEEMDVVVAGQAQHATNFGSRALANPVENGFQVNRDTTVFVNLADRNWYNNITEWCNGEMNAWASSAGRVTLAVGGLALRATVPRVSADYAVYQQLIAGVVRPGSVDRALNIAIVVEAAQGGVFAPPALAALTVLDVCVVNWDAAELSRREGDYLSTVQVVLVGTLPFVTDWTTVTSMTNVGASGQLLTSGNSEGIVYSAHKVSGAELELGWMMAGAIGVVPRNDMYSMVNAMRRNVKIREYFVASIKKKGF